MKKTLILIVLVIKILTNTTMAQSPNYKVSIPDALNSTIGPVVATIGMNSYITGLRVPPGTGGDGYLSSVVCNTAGNKTSDSVFLNLPTVSSDMATVSLNSFVYTVSSRAQNNGDIFLVKRDVSNNIISSNILQNVSGSGFDNAIVLKMSANNLFVAGASYSTNISTWPSNAFICKIDTLGNPIWTKFFNGFAATSVAVTPSGNILVLVRSYDQNWNTVENVLTLDSFGNTLFTNSIPSGYNALALCFGEREGSAIVCLREIAATSLIAFMTVDQAGNSGSVILTNQAGSIVKVEDSYAGFVVAGTFGGAGFASSGAYLGEFDIQSGNAVLLWQKKIFNAGAMTYAFTGLAKRGADLGWVACGTRSRPIVGVGTTYDLLVTKVAYLLPDVSMSVSSYTICPGQPEILSVPYDSNSTYIWKKYGNVVGTNSNILNVTTSGKYKVIVTTSYGVSRSSTSIVISVGVNCRNSFEDLISESQEKLSKDIFTIFPNPVDHQINLVGVTPGSAVFISDILGKVIFSQKVTETKDVIDVSALNPGVYFIVCENKSLKFLKQ